MLISLESLLMKGDYINDFNHQHLFKTQPKNKSQSSFVKTDRETVGSSELLTQPHHLQK